ncbi:hypothetical protein QQS21_008582 [Conoideocrella luteorostrata]|uniref:Uncharacterized protein n=1 Tax=Conoideocrella luteorostrata TaxID=1105319 RepID=A0AAJ0CJH5_9HYPO|nr:hypothetical protein QQS21_008582 [Conoideocrella luteorostrata]
MNPAHLPIHEQITHFQAAVSTNKTLLTVLSRAATLRLPNWYLAGGSISQTIWNHVSRLPPEHGIQDYDLVYHDPSDLSWEAEDAVIQKGKTLFADIPVEVEIRNQARVHLWYGPKYGIECPERTCTESSIEQWLTTSAMVGVTLREEDGSWSIFAPRGFSDFFNLIVRPHQELGTREAYVKKVDRWMKHWKDLTVIPWTEHHDVRTTQ